jgi:hypothetical protein
VNPTPLAGRPVRVVIRRAGITGASSTEVRRLADGLVPALERAFAALRNGESVAQRHRPAPSDRVASEVAAAVSAKLRGAP